jgi:hypothetical protein
MSKSEFQLPFSFPEGISE